MSGCGQLHEGQKAEIESAFRTLMANYDLSFTAQANAGFTMFTLDFGLPHFSRLLAASKTPLGKKLVLARISSVLVFSLLLLQSFLFSNTGGHSEDPLYTLRVFLINPIPNNLVSILLGYNLVLCSMLIFDLLFLITDFVILWVMGVDKTVGRIGIWFLVTLSLSCVLGFYIGIPLEIILDGVLMINLEGTKPVITIMLTGCYFTLVVATFIVSAIFRWYIRYFKSKIIDIEAKYTAIRKCLHTTEVSTGYITPTDQDEWIRWMLSRVRMDIGKRFLTMSLLVLSVAVSISYLPQVHLTYGLTATILLALISIFFIGGSWSFLIRLLHDEKVLIQEALDSIWVIMLVLVTPALLTDLVIINILVIILLTLFGLGYAFSQVKELARDRFELFGELYYSLNLQVQSIKDVESFMRATLEEMSSVLSTFA